MRFYPNSSSKEPNLNYIPPASTKKIIKCPKCNSEIKIVRETNWDNLDTYLYPVCNNCKWTTKEVFYNEEQILEYIKMKF